MVVDAKRVEMVSAMGKGVSYSEKIHTPNDQYKKAEQRRWTWMVGGNCGEKEKSPDDERDGKHDVNCRSWRSREIVVVRSVRMST